MAYAGVGQYVLTAPLEYDGKRETVVVPIGFRTDLASIPAAMRWLVPADGTWTTAAVLHDALCDALNRGEPVISSRDTDGLFRRVMREADVAPVRRWLLWVGVRYGALVNPRRRAEWWRDLPTIVPLTLLAVPLVAPATVAVTVGLVVYAVVEAAVSLFPHSTSEAR